MIKREREENTLTMGQAMTVIAALATALEKARRRDEAEVPARAPERAPAGLSDVRALSQLPVIGGSDFDAERVAKLIASEAFQARYERGMSVSVYIAANDAFRTAGRTMRCPIYKVGICASERLYQRQLELDRDGYGSMIMCGGEAVRDPAFGSWDLLRMPRDVQLSPESPIAVGERDLRVTLPAGMKFSVFDSLLTEALRPASLSVWAGSSAGQRYCETHGIDAASLVRFTAYEFGSGTRLSPATELMIVRPKSEMQRLANLVEVLIADWLLTKE